MASSFCVSVDAAQAWHPGFPDKFDDAFSPVLNGGPAVKANANFKYATDARFRKPASGRIARMPQFRARSSPYGPI
jgi:aspartyl aminopeptidase